MWDIRVLFLHFQLIHASKAHQGNRKTFGMERLENPFLLGKSSSICFDQFKYVSTYLFRSCPNKKMIMTVGFLHWRYGICTSVYLTAMNMLVSHDRWLSALFLIRIQHTTRYTHHIKHIQYPVCWVPTFSPISQREMSRICYEMLFEIISGQIPWVYIAVCIILCLYCMLKIC